MSQVGFQLRLQRELFDPSGEQLLSLVRCTLTTSVLSDAKKSKCLYLALCNSPSKTQQGIFHITLHELKSAGLPPSSPSPSSNTVEELPKKKRSWDLRAVRGLDGKYDSSIAKGVACLQFSLTFASGSGDQEPKAGAASQQVDYTANNEDEKNKFLMTLINLSLRQSRGLYHRDRAVGSVDDRGSRLSASGAAKIAASNLPPEVQIVEEDNEKRVGGGDSTWPIKSQDEMDGFLNGGGYEPISSKESSDLLQLMQKCEHAVTNADVFVEDLSRELNVLDGANIYSIMASEENIDKLMEMLERAIAHTETIESRLNQYDDLLEHIRDSMDKMEGKTTSIETVNSNNKTLLDCLQNVVHKLDLPYKHQATLSEADLSSSRKLRECVTAAKALQRVLSADLDPNLAEMKSAQSQIKRCEKLRDRFARAVFKHLTNHFVHLGNDTEHLDAGTCHLKLSRRKHIHKELMKYSELVHWLKAMDPKSFATLQATYRQNLCKLYEKDIRRFFEMARFKVSGNSKTATLVAGSTTDLAGGKKQSKPIPGLLGTDTDSVNSELSLSERERFDDVLETILIELEDICMDEQFFSISFFRMEQIDRANPDPRKDKKVMEEARGMMAEIFPSLESELLSFVSFYERSDSFFTMHALVGLSKHVLSTQDTGSFLAISFGTVLVQIKRNFDKFMQIQLSSVQEARAPRKNKCGILPFISNFEGFVNTTEGIFRQSERRSDLEKWYSTLVAEMCSTVVRISREHTKTPAEVIKMENYHHLHGLMAKIKITALETQKKEVKQKYNDALSAYTTQYFGRPLDKLNVFFEGVQQLVSAGVKESEIGYQLAYSKQELRKVINMYPGKEVKKGLESLYKKVERHLCEEEGLVQVVWRAMQGEFITQYKNIEDLIQRCYPGAQLSLEFTINEVLDYFSDIARSH